MKLFILKILIYSFVTVGLLYLFPITIYFLSKDYISIKEATELQLQHKDILVSFSYFGGKNLEQKMILLEKVSPSTIAFGTSRTFQIRKEFFNKPDEFVNASVPRPSIGNLVNFKSMLEKLPNDGKKRTVIMLLDKRFFTESYDSSSDRNGDSFFLKFSHLIGKPLRLMYLDYFTHKYSIADLVEQSHTSRNIGLWSLVRDSGFRLDGSMKEGYEIKIPNRKEILQNDISGRVHDIKNYSQELLQKEEAIIPKNLDGLKEILEDCKNRNIVVIGFIPPDPILVSKEIDSNDTAYAKVQTKLVRDISSIFVTYKYPFYDLSDITEYNGKDAEFIDLTHGGDLLYAKVILYLAEHDSNVRNVVNLKGLQDMIKNTKGDFLNF